MRGREVILRSISGARVIREVQMCGRTVPEHRHEWASLILPVLGSFTSADEEGHRIMDGPSALLHPPRSAHAASIGPMGLEAINIKFDPAWLRKSGFEQPLDRAHSWHFGKAAFAARSLVRLCVSPDTSGEALATGLATFLSLAPDGSQAVAPHWLEAVRRELTSSSPKSAHQLGNELGLHPAWIRQVYRATTGEGLGETVRRRRVSRAAFLLRETDKSIVAIADESGFCDQSHMNRCFAALLGRTPLRVRSESKSDE